MGEGQGEPEGEGQRAERAERRPDLLVEWEGKGGESMERVLTEALSSEGRSATGELKDLLAKARLLLALIVCSLFAHSVDS